MDSKLLAVLLAALPGAAFATPQVSGDGACGIRAVDNASFVSCDGDRAPEPLGPVDESLRADFIAPMPVTATQAWRMKRDLGSRLLIVDVRARPEILFTGMPQGVDANIPFMEPGSDLAVDARTGMPAMDYNIRFLHRMDELLRASRLRHGDAVVLLCRSGERSRLAAELMREHGYLQVFVVQGGFEGAHASGTGEADGWKSAGLPWTARIEPGWLYAEAPPPAH